MNLFSESTDEIEQLDAELAELDDGLVSVAEQLLSGMDRLIALQQQQIQMIGMLSRQINSAMLAPKRVVRDENGRVIGAEPVLGE